MRLGGSLSRHRRRRTRTGGEHEGGDPGRTPPPRGSLEDRAMLALKAVTLALVGWGAGYLVATRVVFPAPPPPSNLFEMPDLRGMSLSAADEQVQKLGLTVAGVDSVRHPTVAEGVVFGQSPLPGQLAMPKTPVRMTVSLGPQIRAVPDVRDLDATRARVVLETSGFVVATDSTQSDTPRGRVVDVSPPPDSLVPLPAEVRMTVSTGPPLVSMPMVLGLTQEDAVAKLDSLGLVVSEIKEVFRFGRDQGIVVEQEPAADTRLAPGSAVQLSVGRRSG